MEKLIKKRLKEAEKKYYNLKEKRLLCGSEKKGIMFFPQYIEWIKLKQGFKL